MVDASDQDEQALRKHHLQKVVVCPLRGVEFKPLLISEFGSIPSIAGVWVAIRIDLSVVTELLLVLFLELTHVLEVKGLGSGASTVPESVAGALQHEC